MENKQFVEAQAPDVQEQESIMGKDPMDAVPSGTYTAPKSAGPNAMQRFYPVEGEA